MNRISKNTKIGDVVTMNKDTVYKVVNIYQITNEYMEQHNLYHKNRITLKKIKGEGQDQLDFAFTY